MAFKQHMYELCSRVHGLTIDNKYVTGIRNIQDRMCIVRVSLLRLRQYPWAAMGELVRLIQSMIL